MSMRAVLRFSACARIRVPPHHGRNCGYRSMRSTSSNIRAGAYGTSTLFMTRCMIPPRRPSRGRAALSRARRMNGPQRSRVAPEAPMSIVENRKAFHDYFIEEQFEAGIALEGWEVKAIRGNRAHLKEAYVIVRNGGLMLIGAHISPLSTASTHVRPDPVRTRRLLMHREEINRLIGKVERAGYTLTPIDLHYKNG